MPLRSLLAAAVVGLVATATRVTSAEPFGVGVEPVNVQADGGVSLCSGGSIGGG